MKYTRVYIDALGVELPAEVVPMHHHEHQLADLMAELHIPAHFIESSTGISERRFWPRGASSLASAGAKAARKALAAADVGAADVGAVIFASVCREHFEPATACLIAAALDVPSTALIYDLSNACLGALNALVELANHIELGHMRAGLVVACESSRELIEQTVATLLQKRQRDAFFAAVATLTGGSGAVAVVVTDGSFPNGERHRLLGATARSASQHHQLCRWGLQPTAGGLFEQVMTTDAQGVLKHGLALGVETWRAFLSEMQWRAGDVDHSICHQVSKTHRQQILSALQLEPERDFPTLQYLGNIGSVSLPLTAAVAAQDGFLQQGDQVAWLGIGSGLNCLMLGFLW